MRIAIIDDVKADQTRLMHIINACFDHISLFVYENAADAMKGDLEYDLVLLDIKLGEESGIDAARLLETRASCIVYVTAAENRVRDAFGYHVAGYLFKSMSDAQLIEELKRIDETYLSLFITLHTVHGDIRVRQNQIVYITAFKREVTCYFRDQRKVLLKNMTLKKCMELLDKRYFMLINRSDIVNLLFITAIEDQKIILKDGIELYASRRAQSEVEKEWIRRFV